MARWSTKAKAVLSLLIVAGFAVAYAGVWLNQAIAEPITFIFAFQGLIFWVGVVASVLLFIWGVLPRWLMLLAWTILVVYFSVLLTGGSPAPWQSYLVVVFFSLFVIFLAKWIRDVRSTRRIVQQLDEPTLRELGFYAGTTVARGTPRSERATRAPLRQLDPATVRQLQDLVLLGRQLENDRGEGSARALAGIRALESTLAARGVRRSVRTTALEAALFLLGSALGAASFQQVLSQALSQLLGSGS